MPAENDVFYEIAEKLNALPEDIQKAYEESCIESVDNAANKVEKFFRKNSGSTTLNEQMVTSKTLIPHVYYERDIDWDDTTAVNVLKGKSYGRDAAKPREKGKRNYSLRPAMSHHLAYIINYAHDGISRNYFITRGMRTIRKRFKERDYKFEAKLEVIAKKFE